MQPCVLRLRLTRRRHKRRKLRQSASASPCPSLPLRHPHIQHTYNNSSSNSNNLWALVVRTMLKRRRKTTRDRTSTIHVKRSPKAPRRPTTQTHARNRTTTRKDSLHRPTSLQTHLITQKRTPIWETAAGTIENRALELMSSFTSASIFTSRLISDILHFNRVLLPFSFRYTSNSAVYIFTLPYTGLAYEKPRSLALLTYPHLLTSYLLPSFAICVSFIIPAFNIVFQPVLLSMLYCICTFYIL